MIHTLKKVKRYLTTLMKVRLLQNDPHLKNLVNPQFRFPAKSNEYHIDLILQWYLRSMDFNKDGGIPAKINLLDYVNSGKTYFPSYPETSGYILASLIYAHHKRITTFPREKIDAVASYLVNVQNKDGGYASTHTHRPGISMAFNTGQVLCGLSTYYSQIESNESIKSALLRAGNFLADQIQPDGTYCEKSCFNGKRSYYIRATVGLIMAGKLFDEKRWIESAKRNAKLVFSNQNTQGWYDLCSFEDGPLFNLHGLSYTIDGMMSCGLLLNEDSYIESAKRAIDAIMSKNYEESPFPGLLPAHFSKNYERTSNELSPTGVAQFSIPCSKLSKLFNEKRYSNLSNKLIQHLKPFHIQDSKPEFDGLMPGSWPIYGRYQPFDLPSWPIKFFLDGLLIDQGMDPLEVTG